jgi:hypothetical protein
MLRSSEKKTEYKDVTSASKLQNAEECLCNYSLSCLLLCEETCLSNIQPIRRRQVFIFSNDFDQHLAYFTIASFFRNADLILILPLNRQEIYLFSKTWRRAMGNTQPPIQWVPGFFPENTGVWA